MKKSMIFAAMLAAAAVSASCSKSEPVKASSEPQTLTLSAEMPALEIDTKMSVNPSDDKQLFWQSGDGIRLIVQDAMPASSNVEGTGWTDCGVFTTTDSGSKTASFTGTIPAGAVGTQYGIAVWPANLYVSTSAVKNTGTGYYLQSIVTIPNEQDGTGAKYMQGIAKLKDGVLGNFAWSTGMFKMTLPAGKGITKIVLKKTAGASTFKYPACDHALYFKNDEGAVVKFTSAQKVPTYDTITIYNGGAELSGVQYITTRNGDGADVYSITFKNSSDNVIKTLQISGGQAAGYGRLLNLGDLSSYFE